MLKYSNMEGSLGPTLWGSTAENVNMLVNDTVVVTVVLVRDQALCSTQQSCIEVCMLLLLIFGGFGCSIMAG